MFGRCEAVNHRAPKGVVAWLMIWALWSSAASAGEPVVYPQTAYAPLVLAAADEEPSPITFSGDVRRDEQVVEVPSSDSDRDLYHGSNTFVGGPTDAWMWGCGGSPFRTGPGDCDTWEVGPVWDVAVDGMTLFRENANLFALETAAVADGAPADLELREQFDYGGGARVFALGTMPCWQCYQLQFAYEGITEWNAALVFPEVPAIPGPPPPAGAVPDPAERRTLNYTSNWHSAEINFNQAPTGCWTPFVGIRYLKFDDELSDLTDQEASPPLPGPAPGQPSETVDTLNLFDVENDLVGLQVGLRRDLWRLCERFTLQGFVNSGIYYNNASRFNLTSLTTTRSFADDTDTADVDESRTATSSASNAVASEVSDIAYAAEASLTGICRLNKCVALRGGYQLLWINGVRLAENAYLGSDLPARSLTFQGWHVGVEYRR